MIATVPCRRPASERGFHMGRKGEERGAVDVMSMPKASVSERVSCVEEGAKKRGAVCVQRDVTQLHPARICTAGLV